MVVTRKLATNSFQERLSKDDIALTLKLIDYAYSKFENYDICSETRLQLLIGKLHRMEKQK